MKVLVHDVTRLLLIWSVFTVQFTNVLLTCLLVDAVVT